MIETVKTGNNNYTYIVTIENKTVIIDPGFSEILNHINKRKIDLILLTHNHRDHNGAVNEIISLNPDAKINMELYDIKKIITPGHTNDSVCWYIPGQRALFTGDTLFTGGCGKVFNNNYRDMHNSLCKISELPDNTLIYPGHEYLRIWIDFYTDIGYKNTYTNLLSKEFPSAGVTLKEEKENNPFLTEDFATFLDLRKRKNSL